MAIRSAVCLAHALHIASSKRFAFDSSIYYFLFRRFRKIARTDYWLRYVRPPVRPRGTAQLPWTNFHDVWNLSIYRTNVEEIQVSLKTD